MADRIEFSANSDLFTISSETDEIVGDTEQAKQIVRGLVHFLRDKGLNCGVSDGHVVFTHLPQR